MASNLELLTQCLEMDTLSQSEYDIAAAALVKGQHQAACIDWLLKNRRSNGTWGDPRSWHDCYISTYSAALALHAAGYVDQAAIALKALPGLAQQETVATPETLTFGVLIAALDRISTNRLGLTPPVHPQTVQQLIEGEAKKTKKLVAWSGFYEPMISVGGFTGERVYKDDSIDLEKFIRSFSIKVGGIAGSPGASAITLLAAQEAGIEAQALQAYVESLNPAQRTIGVLESVDYFAVAWSLMYWHELGNTTVPEHPAIKPLKYALYNRNRRHMVSAGGSAGEDMPCPGELDTSAASMLALQVPGRVRRRMLAVTGPLFFNGTCYTTHQYEVNPSVTTNVHMVGAWPENVHTGNILNWLSSEMDSCGAVTCKWHVSYVYATGELVRIFSRLALPQARDLARRAASCLIESQHADGGWGLGYSTHEETGYAVLGLCAAQEAGLINFELCQQVLTRADSFLSAAPLVYEKLWIGKSLYCVKPITLMLSEVSRVRIAQLQGSYAFSS
jgi:hypothetical protein